MHSRNNAGNTRGRPFSEGNPGRPHGARNKVTRIIEEMFIGESETVGRKAIELAKDGDTAALKLILDRVAPVRRARIRFQLPPVETVHDLPCAIAAVLVAIADGTLSPEEGNAIASAITAHQRMFETVELEGRIAALEARGA